jgi:hypothetical protein
VFDLPSGGLRYVSSAPTGVIAVALSPNGEYLAYGTGKVLYAYDFRTGRTITVSTLPGYNLQPNWLQDGSHPCLLFANLQTAGNTIYLACLAPQLGWAKVTQGEYPEWLGP